MQAVVESGGFQYKVTEQSTIYVPKMRAEIGDVLHLPKVLMVYDENEVLVGSPYLEGASVEGRVVSHGKRRKIIVYKYKSKKNYRRKRGHRQDFTELLITKIGKPGKPAKAAEQVSKEGVERAMSEAAAPGEAAQKKTAEKPPKKRRRILRRRREPKKG